MNQHTSNRPAEVLHKTKSGVGQAQVDSDCGEAMSVFIPDGFNPGKKVPWSRNGLSRTAVVLQCHIL